MKKIVYSEPESYFPKKIRKAAGLEPVKKTNSKKGGNTKKK